MGWKDAPVEKTPAWASAPIVKPDAAKAPAEPTKPSRNAVLQGAADVVGGAIRGAGSIGATLLSPFDIAMDLYYGDRKPTMAGLITGKQPLSRNQERRRDIDEGLRNLLGADPESMTYGAGKLAGEIAGTAGFGPALATGARAVPALVRFAPALETAGVAPQMPAGVANLAARAGAGATVGGGSTFLADPSQTGTGAGIGAAVGLGAPLVMAGGRLVRRGAEGLYRGSKASALLTAAEGRGQELVNMLRGNTEIVPGSLPTAGEAAAPLNLLRYAALQKTASQVPELRSAYFQRGGEQQAARQAAVRGVGKTPAELEAAKAARGAEAKKLYGVSGKKMAEADAALMPLLERPSMEEAITRARKMAEEAGDDFSVGRNVPEQIVPSNILDASGNPVSQTVIPAETAKYSGKSLHYIKMALDDMVAGAPRAGIGASNAKLIGDTRADFIRWVEKNVPEYETARKAYATASKPINQMEVGQYLEGKLVGALDDERGRVFAAAVKDAPGTVKRATTGAPRAQELGDLLTPQQVKAVESVQEDLARGELFRKQTAGAATTGPVASKTASAGVPAIPSLLVRIQTVATALIQRTAGKMDRKLAIEIATEMLDPRAAATAMEKALSRQAKIDAARRGVAKVTGAVPPQVAAPIAINALTPRSQNALSE